MEPATTIRLCSTNLSEADLPDIDPLACDEEPWRQRELLRRYVGDLHGRLDRHGELVTLVERMADLPPSRDRPWVSHCLIRTPFVWTGLTTFYRFDPVPLHDHPGACGIQMVLSGRLRIAHHQPADGSSLERPVVTLEQTGERELGVGESAVVGRRHDNIHGLRILTPRCIVLNLVVMDPTERRRRSWYLPIALSQAGNRAEYKRLPMERSTQDPHDRGCRDETEKPVDGREEGD